MVVKRENGFIRKAKDIAVGGALGLALLSGGALLQSCGNNDSTEEYETVYTKGVETYVSETEPGVFKITDEKVVGEGESKAVVTYLDGREERLNVAQAKELMGTQSADSTTALRNGNQPATHTGTTHYHGGGLSNIMLGYFLARSLGGVASPGYYANPGVYSRAQQNTSTVRSSRVSRPSGGSRGFFRSGGSGSSSRG